MAIRSPPKPLKRRSGLTTGLRIRTVGPTSIRARKRGGTIGTTWPIGAMNRNSPKVPRIRRVSLGAIGRRRSVVLIDDAQMDYAANHRNRKLRLRIDQRLNDPQTRRTMRPIPLIRPERSFSVSSGTFPGAFWNGVLKVTILPNVSLPPRKNAEFGPPRGYFRRRTAVVLGVDHFRGRNGLSSPSRPTRASPVRAGSGSQREDARSSR
jgi:hypothetical protein